MAPRRSKLPQKLGPLLLFVLLFPGSFPPPPVNGTGSGRAPSQSDSAESQQTRAAREGMIQDQIMARGIRDPRVLEALRKIPRHRFVPPEMQPYAYDDTPLPIGLGQTISQPYMVAFMTEALELRPQDRVLEIGTGSGYQAAVLSLLAREVCSMEIIERLGQEAGVRLEQMGYRNVRVRIGNGYRGWPEAAPFDAIIVTAAPPDVPAALVEQLRVGGRMLIPVGSFAQDLLRLRRTAKGIERENLLPVRFVPMVPEGQRAPK